MATDRTPIAKPWGTCWPLYDGPNVQVDRLEIVAGGESSRHYHNDKDNLFIVTNGLLDVICYPGRKTESTTRLCGGMTYNVKRTILHQFKAITNCELIEIYTAMPGCGPVRRDDIVRLCE